MASRRAATLRPLNNRITRRSALFAGGTVAFLVACGGDDKKDEAKAPAGAPPRRERGQPDATTGQAKFGGTLPSHGRHLLRRSAHALPIRELTYLAQIPEGTLQRSLRSIADKDTNWDDHSKLGGDVALLPEQPDR
jgi:hypothetical protein